MVRNRWEGGDATRDPGIDVETVFLTAQIPPHQSVIDREPRRTLHSLEMEYKGAKHWGSESHYITSRLRFVPGHEYPYTMQWRPLLERQRTTSHPWGRGENIPTRPLGSPSSGLSNLKISLRHC